MDSSRRILESDLNEPSSFLHHLFERGSFLPLSFASLERRETKTSVCTESLRYRRCLVVSVHDTPTEIEAYVSRIEKGDRMDFEMATFRDNFIPPGLSVTSWRDNTLSLFVRLHGVSSERRPPFVAWANVFYSIKQTRYLVGKLVRTQRCDVGALRESREGKRYPLADIFKA